MTHGMVQFKRLLVCINCYCAGTKNVAKKMIVLVCLHQNMVLGTLQQGYAHSNIISIDIYKKAPKVQLEATLTFYV